MYRNKYPLKIKYYLKMNVLYYPWIKHKKILKWIKYKKIKYKKIKYKTIIKQLFISFIYFFCNVILCNTPQKLILKNTTLLVQYIILNITKIY